MTGTHSGFHPGEAAVQARANVPPEWRERAARLIRSAMPDQHRAFFESQPALFLGLLDERGRPWASAAFGRPGFARSPDPETLTIGARPLLAEALSLRTGAGAKIGLLGIEFASRRRNRMNGTIVDDLDGEIAIAVDQSFGNCPQYIQSRPLARPAAAVPTPQATRIAALAGPLRRAVEAADTLFIASRSRSLSQWPGDGVDVSHRGGRPGFLGLGEDGRLSFPDFAGNRFFNTLGNIEADGRVGLLVPDFRSGAAILLTGRAAIDWSPDRIRAFAGAERIVDITPDEVWQVDDALPLRGETVEPWPRLGLTGIWAEARGRPSREAP